jgi:hypothetical protein
VDAVLAQLTHVVITRPVTSGPDPTGLYEGDDHWVLPVGGEEVSQICLDYSFNLVTTMGSGVLTVRISGPFTVAHHDEVGHYDPEDSQSLGELLYLRKAVADDARAHKDGRLTFKFVDGTVITVEPDPHYEAFHVTAGYPQSEQLFELMAMPGGGLAVTEPV